MICQMPELVRWTTLGVPVSIDTCKAGVMQRALDLGVDIVNDVRALADDGAEDVWLVCVGGKSLVKGKATGPAYHQARRMAEAALEKVGAEQVSGGLADTDIVWRKGGVARRLGRDEQHLYEALRWLGLSSRSMNDEEAKAWEQAEAMAG